MAKLVTATKVDVQEVSNSINDTLSDKVNKSGDTMTGDLQVLTHAQVGELTDFTTGGHENFAVGHKHKFFGKESFAIHDGNRVGAKGFYWKAIDTTNHKIYLSKTQPAPDPRCLPIVDVDGKSFWIATDPTYNVPYYGPKADSKHQELFTSESGINLVQSKLVNQFITVVNVSAEIFTKCFRVESIENGSIINYSDVKTISSPYNQTLYRKSYASGSTITFHDNQYVVFFPEIDQKTVICDDGTWVTSTSFGCTALGDGNHVMGYNSFATGCRNRVEQSYSVAAGYENKATQFGTIALGTHAEADSVRSFVWNGYGQSYYKDHGEATVNFNPRPTSGDDPFTGVYIGSVPLSDRTIKKSDLVTALNAIDTTNIQDQNAKNAVNAIINALKNL